MKGQLITLLVFFAVLSCKKDNEQPSLPPVNPAYVWPTQSWSAKPPGEVGLSAAPLDELSAAIGAGNFGAIHSLLIVKGGYLVFEKYYNGASATQSHELQSATKSVASVLAGIAIDKGFFSEEDTVVRLLSGTYAKDGNALRRAMIVKDILTMRHGMQWKEWGYPKAQQDNIIMANSPDWIQYLLDRPMQTPPGTVFNYSTGASVFISGMIHHRTSVTTDSFARAHLFSPIGIHSADWWVKDSKGMEHTGGALKLTAPDMARFGFLILKDGVWDGRQIISRAFLDRSFAPATSNVLTVALNGEQQALHYGYHWWIIPVAFNNRTVQVIAAMGTGGQYIFIIKEFDLVVVTTGWNLSEPAQSAPVGWLKKDILPALK